MKVLIKINISDLQTESRMGDRKKRGIQRFFNHANSCAKKLKRVGSLLA